MDFKMYNNARRSQVDLNACTKHGPDIIYKSYFANDETSEYDKEQADDAQSSNSFRLQQTISGKTYCANFKSIIKDNTQVWTPSTNAVFDNYQGNKSTRHNVHHFNANMTAEVSNKNDRFPNNQYIHYPSREQNIQNQIRNGKGFEEFENNKAKSMLANNVYPTESNYHGKYSEKSTYCRPVSNFYNQEFVYRTLAKNARLQQLVKQLVLVRQKQKEEDLWNNYINELKNRHEYCRENGSTPLRNSEEIPPERIEDYNTRFQCRQSVPCRNLLKDFYKVHNNFNRNVDYKRHDFTNIPRQENYRQYVYENKSFCYPTSSQGRLMMLNKERQDDQFANHWPQHLQNRHFRGNTIFVDSECNKSSRNQIFRRLLGTKCTNTTDSQIQSKNNTSTQTDFRCLFPISEYVKDDSRVESAKDRYKQVAKNVERLKRKLEKSNSDVKQNTLHSIESKLNDLIQTLNTFMVDVRANNPFSRDSKSVSVSSRVKDNGFNELNAAKSDTFGIIKREEVICRAAHENSSATSPFLVAGPSTRYTKDPYMKIDKILNEQMDKSNKVKRDIEDMMYKRTHLPRAVQITFDIPTRERATEVTDSLSKAKIKDKMPIEEIGNSTNTNERRMTIAVNTDPMGLLALLRISSEAVKQILSYMPHIDYYSYLSMLQFPQSRNGLAHYVCNICGASFQRPSLLSDHIQTHNLGYSRDCCVCRHVLDMQRRRPGLFKCKYCGQRFTRAYCCDLHEETCARRLGVPHDVKSNRNLLQ